MTTANNPSTIGRRQVLLAEDDPDYRDLIADALACDGYDVVAVANGAEAMNYIDIAFRDPLTTGFPSVVITDIRMPIVDGLGLLAYAAFIPTVVMTAFGSPAIHAEARKRGARRVFDKPFDVTALVAVVRMLTGDRDTHLPHPRLLIADDDHDFVTYLSDLLIAHDAATVVTAFSGVDALEELAEEGPFDLVLTDHRMPGPSGAQLVTMARYAGYDGPFLIVTAFPGSDVERVVENHERVRLIPKSAKPNQIIRAAAQMIGEGNRAAGVGMSVAGDRSPETRA